MKKLILICLLLCFVLSSCGENVPVSGGAPTIVTEEIIDGKPKSEHIISDDERITITSLGVWDEFNFDGNFSDNCLLFLRGFIEGYSQFSEFESVKISNWEIIRDTKVYGYDMAFNFTVTKSNLDTLPVGEYKTIITDGVDCYMEFVEAPRGNVDTTMPSSKAELAIYDWLSFAQYSDFEEFGKWEKPLYAHYIRSHYTSDGVITFSDFARLAKDKFGMEVTKEMFQSSLYIEDMTLYITTSGSDLNQSFDFVDETAKDGVITVTVQHYADCNKLIKSDLIAYHIDEDERFLSSEILNFADYAPYGLRSIK